MDPSGETSKSDRDRAGRAGGRVIGAYRGASGYGKRRVEALGGGAEAGGGSQGVGSLFSGAAVALGSFIGI